MVAEREGKAGGGNVRLPGKRDSREAKRNSREGIQTRVVERPWWRRRSGPQPRSRFARPPPACRGEFFIDNLLVRNHFIIAMIRWSGLAPCEFEFNFPGSFTSTFLVGCRMYRGVGDRVREPGRGARLLLQLSRHSCFRISRLSSYTKVYSAPIRS